MLVSRLTEQQAGGEEVTPKEGNSDSVTELKIMTSIERKFSG